MPDKTPILALPVLVPNQAQPYVTHNDALRRLDILVQLSVIAFGAETPPALPGEGDLYALGAAPVAAWAGQADALAVWIDGSWLFLAPQPGWRAWDRDAGLLRVWDGTAWARPPAELDNVAGVGIGTASDAVNRLAVVSEATLFSHDGAGHQLKINKAGTAETASLLFQSNWTGHAEMGLAGGTDFAIKVSGDGSAWTEALRFDAASGEAFGAAVQASAADTTPGRLPKMGNDADFAELTADVLGIGPVGPFAPLHVTGDGAGTTEAIRMSNPTGAASALTSDKAVVISADRDNNSPTNESYVSFEADGSETARIDSSGRLLVGATSGTAKVQASQSSNSPVFLGEAKHATYTNDAISLNAARAASPAYTYLKAFSGDFTDLEFKLSGDGNGTCDGAWTGGGADYAEYFEWADGNPEGADRRGLSVVLEGAKIRPARDGEHPIGVISGNPSVIGDGDIDRWKDKYLRDDFGAYLWEAYEITDEDGNAVIQQRRRRNPAYDPALDYTPRSERPEWDVVGLMGKLRLRRSQPVAPSWIRMRAIGETVEEWLVI